MKPSSLDTIILASASPRRAELLRAAGIAFEIHPAHIDEAVHDGESADAYVLRIAHAKARAVASRFPDRIVLGADTTVVVDGQILGKPRDEEDARRILSMLSGRVHDVLSAVCVCGPAEVKCDDLSRREGRHEIPRTRDAPGCDVQLARTSVEFAPLSDEEIAWYVSSGEPADKAGAYAIQGLASRFVIRIDGSYSNVVGLPVALVYEMLSSRA